MDHVKSGKVIPPRVFLLESANLDTLSLELLKSKLAKLFGYLNSNKFVWYEAEIEALLQVALLKFNLLDTGSTMGQRLFGISTVLAAQQSSAGRTYHKKFIAYTLGVVLWSWLQKRHSLIAKWLSGGNRTRQTQLSNTFINIETTIDAISFVNLLLFLRHGTHHPSLLGRLLGMEASASRPLYPTEGDYSLFVSHLLWRNLSDCLSLLVPLVQKWQLGKAFSRFIFGSESSVEGVKSVANISADELSSGNCLLCRNPAVLPHHIGCRHAYCYACLQTKLSANPNAFRCVACSRAPSKDNQIQILISV